MPALASLRGPTPAQRMEMSLEQISGLTARELLQLCNEFRLRADQADVPVARELRLSADECESCCGCRPLRTAVTANLGELGPQDLPPEDRGVERQVLL